MWTWDKLRWEKELAELSLHLDCMLNCYCISGRVDVEIVLEKERGW